MSPGTIALIVVAVSVAAWAAFMANITIRRQRKNAVAADARANPQAAGTDAPRHDEEEATAAGSSADVKVETVAPERRKPLTRDELAVSRRQFLNRASAASFMGFLGLFGMSSLSFLWPKLTGGFGTTIAVGNIDDLLKEVGPEAGFLPKFIPEGRFWLAYYEGTGEDPSYTAVNAVNSKLVALYRKCVHLGCSVPHCSKSMLFECPCHGSKYRLHGEFYGGPAPRGLDRFPIEVSGSGTVSVDTGSLQIGPPRGVNTWERFAEPQGDLCVPT